MSDWPTVVTTTELDADSDSPLAARPQILAAAQAVNTMVGAGAPFNTRADVTTATIDGTVSRITTFGYAAVGDGGGALYKRVGAEPSHALKVQSADGAWWELVPDTIGINVKQAGAVGDGTTDDSQAFIDAVDGVDDLDASGVNKATHDVIAPEGDYDLAATSLELKRVVRIIGAGSGVGNAPRATILRWDANVTGIIVHHEDTTGATTEGAGTGTAQGSVLEGLKLEGGGGTIAGVTDDTKGHGIWLRQKTTLRDIAVSGFAGNGIHILATLAGSADVKGNANTWHIESLRSSGNHLSGVYVDGADVNAGRAIGVDVADNGRWGINDSSFLGNTWLGVHSASNGLAGNGENGAGESSWVDFGGNRYAAHRDATEAQLVATEPGTDESVWRFHSAGSADVTWTAAQPEGTFFPGGDIATDNANARNLFLGTYTEGNCAPPQLVRPTMAIGAHRGKKWLGTFYGFDLGSQEAVVGGPNWRFKNHETASPDRDLTLDLNPFSNCLAVLLAESDHANGVQLAHWEETRGNWGFGTHGNNSSKTPLWLTTDLNTRTYGRGSAIGAGFPAFERGLFFGNGNANSRYQSYATAEPTTGEHARGDIYWNADQSAGGVLGWACTAGGTPGTWTEIGISGSLADLSDVDASVDTPSDGDILVYRDAGADWILEAKPAGGGGSAVILDLGDDGTNESTDLAEIATSGDTNSIFTEPAADKLLIDLGQNWPTADAADAVAAGGTINAATVAGDLTPNADGTINLGSATFRYASLAVDEIDLNGVTLDGTELADPGADRLVGWDDSAAAGSETSYFEAENGLELTATPGVGMTANQRTTAIEFVIDGGGSAITTGVKGYLEVPFACTIQQVTLLADQSTTTTIDIWKDTYANYPPVDADSITASAEPSTSAANKSQDATLTGWTTAIAAGDILGFNVDANDNATRVTVSLEVLVD